MKKFILSSVLFCLTSFSINIKAQVVTFEPSFATENDTLTLTFDATKGNGGLSGFTGDVYLYTGLITDKSSDPSDWKYVRPAGNSGWESYPAELKMTPLGNDLWEFAYPSSVREFYGVAGSDTVKEVTLLFRGTNDGTGAPDAVGRGDGGSDIFLELTTGSISTTWLQPGGESRVIGSTETLEFTGIGTSTSPGLNLTVFQNEQQVASVENDTVNYTFGPEAAGNYDLKLLAEDQTGARDSSMFRVVVTDQSTLYESRPAGLDDGITYGSSGTVQLSLFAPGKDEVFVIGDFNDWQLDADFIMKKDSLSPDSVWFWTEINGLTPGQQYRMQYLVDGNIRIADPYSELVLDPFNDRFIPESVFPNLPDYPDGITTDMVGVIFPGKTPYNWTAAEYQRPAQDELVIYELLVRDFLEDHSYSSLIDSLDYLERLGVNAIELMPVNEFDGNISWGYNPAFHLALDKYYGDPDTFKRFVDEAHKRGIAVILDVVLNHATGQNPLYRLYDSGSNPYFNEVARHPFNVFNDMNHEYSGTRYYTKRVIEYWLEEYKVDGFRYDLSKGFTQVNSGDDVGAWGNYDQSRIDIWKDYASHQWSVEPESYLIMEHFGSNTEEKVLADYGLMLWGNMNGPYSQSTMGYSENSNIYGVLSESRNFNDRHLVGLMESHDEQWIMFKNIAFGNSSGNYNVRELGTALGRQKIAGAFFFTLPGPKMIWQFGELGYGYGDAGEQCLNDQSYCPPSAPGRTSPKPIRWDYYNTPDNPERVKLYKTWSALITLRKASPVFSDPVNTTYDLNGLTKSIVLEHTDTDVVIIGNFGVVSTTLNVPFTTTGTWYDYFEGSSTTINDTDIELTLQPGEFKIFSTREFPTPEDGLATSSEEGPSDIPQEFNLSQNYPNPFNPVTTMQYDVARSGKVLLEVYDILGRKVATLVNANRSAGSYTARFDASDLSSGMYVARLVAGGTVQIRKMTLIK
ncbi:alpha-amylase family glycosyl hydrolase [Balneola sp. MJW-20]|uniref:alpha-amylase family glycosyl hydrolase n=1 Tax=Gracilimonas aurantiaca TaxID=3234185 RepID=UPI00346695C3